MQYPQGTRKYCKSAEGFNLTQLDFFKNTTQCSALVINIQKSHFNLVLVLNYNFYQILP